MEIHDKDGKRINPATEDTLKSIESKVAAGATNQSINDLLAAIEAITGIVSTEATLIAIGILLGAISDQQKDASQKAQVVTAGGVNVDFATASKQDEQTTALETIDAVLDAIAGKQSDATQKTQIVNPDGAVVRMQVPNFGIIADLASADFSLPDNVPFLLKNDNPTDVILEVMPAGGNSYVETNFGQGWNPELIKAIKTNVDGGSLLWGY